MTYELAGGSRKSFDIDEHIRAYLLAFLSVIHLKVYSYVRNRQIDKRKRAQRNKLSSFAF